MAQEEIQKLKELKGEVRGVVFKTDASYILKKFGEKGLAKLKEKTKELGWEIDYQNIKAMAWYPIGLRALSLLAVQQTFQWDEKEIKKMGNLAPKHSLMAGLMMKYFLSLKRVFEEVPKYWQKHYTVGQLEPYEIDEKEKYVVLMLRNFKISPILCPYLLGYFLRIGQFTIKSKKITIGEEKCEFKGDSFHQFLMKWE